jgi:glycogen synthase
MIRAMTVPTDQLQLIRAMAAPTDQLQLIRAMTVPTDQLQLIRAMAAPLDQLQLIHCNSGCANILPWWIKGIINMWIFTSIITVHFFQKQYLITRKSR